MELHERLEREWAEYNCLEPAGMVACSSGTAALHLAIECLRLPPLSEVIVPDYTMIACPRAVTLAGCTPLLVGCNRHLLMESALVKAVEPVTARAIMAVHVYGRVCDMDRVRHVREPYRWDGVVEDLAEAHGVPPHAATDAACWSFYRNKIVAGEEGGAVYFRDVSVAKLARSLRNVGFTDAHDYTHVPRGHNYRLSNTHAGLILCSLHEVEQCLRRRREVEATYNELCPAGWRLPPRQAPWVYDLRIPGLSAAKQTEIVHELQEWGVAARHGFKLIHTQGEYQHCKVIEGEDPSTEVVYLPLVFNGWDLRRHVRGVFDLIQSCLS